MSVAASIERKLIQGLDLMHLEVVNESGNHNVPPGAESHFRVVVVADEFNGRRLLERHRRIHALLEEELAGEVHALAVHAYTAQEWRRRFGGAPRSPPCLGGEKRQPTLGAGVAASQTDRAES